MARPTLTERRRLQTRLEIAEAALRLFERLGYDAASFEDVAEEAGMSARTVYRHFSAKDELLSPIVATGTAELAQRLADRPSDEELDEAVLHAYAEMGRSACLTESTLIALLLDVPALRARWLDDLRTVEAALATAIRDRARGTLSEEQSRLTAGVIVTALRTVLESTARTGGTGEQIKTDFGAALRYVREGAALQSQRLAQKS